MRKRVWSNRYHVCDNLDLLSVMSAKGEKVHLIYIDPPFFTQERFDDYSDKWPDLESFLDYMEIRLLTMRAILHDTGSLFLHCDWRTSHHFRLMLDKTFGPDCFLNEIVWSYRHWPTKTYRLQRTHDTILWYRKLSDTRQTFNQLYMPLSDSTQRKSKGKRKQKAIWVEKEGSRIRTRTNSFLEEDSLGSYLNDVWDIPIIAPLAKERVGYSTQKSEALLERVITLASNPGNIVADFFSGSGTTVAVAERLGRSWVACDKNPRASLVLKERLLPLNPKPFQLIDHAPDTD